MFGFYSSWRVSYSYDSWVALLIIYYESYIFSPVSLSCLGNGFALGSIKESFEAALSKNLTSSELMVQSNDA